VTLLKDELESKEMTLQFRLLKDNVLFGTGIRQKREKFIKKKG
jgi:hypothetical protein